MNNMEFELTKEQIEKLGFAYAPDPNLCREHTWNWIPIKTDARFSPQYPLEEIENDVNKVVLELLKEDIEESQVRAVNSIKFTRLFRIGALFNPRQFTALYNIRVLSVDKFTEEPGCHVLRA